MYCQIILYILKKIYINIQEKAGLIFVFEIIYWYRQKDGFF